MLSLSFGWKSSLFCNDAEEGPGLRRIEVPRVLVHASRPFVQKKHLHKHLLRKSPANAQACRVRRSHPLLRSRACRQRYSNHHTKCYAMEPHYIKFLHSRTFTPAFATFRDSASETTHVHFYCVARTQSKYGRRLIQLDSRMKYR